MGEGTAGHNVFGASAWLSNLLARIGVATDSKHVSHLALVLLVAIISLPPLLLSAWSGTAWGSGVDIPFLHDAGVLARLFVVVPVLIIASRAIGMQLGIAMQYLESSSVIPDSEMPDYEDATSDLGRRATSRVIELVLLVAALLAPWFAMRWFPTLEPNAGLSTWAVGSPGEGAFSAAGWWFGMISRPLVGFFLLLWAWRYLAWCLFLRRVGKLELTILAAHPDLTGGLAPVVRAHMSFVLIGFAVHAALSGALADELLYAGATIPQVGPEIAFVMVISMIALVAPLGAFLPGLLRAKNQGLVEYGWLAHNLTGAFDARWQNGGPGLLDSADPSAMADFGADYDTVLNMNAFPVGLRQMAGVGIILFIPFAALVLTQVSVAQLVQSLVKKAI